MKLHADSTPSRKPLDSRLFAKSGEDGQRADQFPAIRALRRKLLVTFKSGLANRWAMGQTRLIVHRLQSYSILH